jgi:hypothetical protein
MIQKSAGLKRAVFFVAIAFSGGALSVAWSAIPKEQTSNRSRRASSNLSPETPPPLLQELTGLSQKIEALRQSRTKQGYRISALREQSLELRKRWREGLSQFSESERERVSKQLPDLMPGAQWVSTQSGELYWVRSRFHRAPVRGKARPLQKARVYLSAGDTGKCAGKPVSEACRVFLKKAPFRCETGGFRELLKPGMERACQFSDDSLLIAPQSFWEDAEVGQRLGKGASS